MYIRRLIFSCVCLFLLTSSAAQAQRTLIRFKTQQIPEKWGYKNSAGKIVIKPRYDYAEAFGYNAAKVSQKGKYGLINREGKIVFPIKNQRIQLIVHDYRKGYYQFQQNKKRGIVDDLGNIIVSSQYDSITLFRLSNQMYGYRVVNNQKIGLLDLRGNVLIAPIYQSLKNITGTDLYQAQQNNKYGLVNEQKKIILPVQYDKIQLFSRSSSQILYKFYQGSKHGLIDCATNRIIFDAVYDYIEVIHERYKSLIYLIEKNKLAGLANQKGEMILSPVYTSVRPADNYYAAFWVEAPQGKGFFLDDRFIVPPKYDHFSFLDKYFNGLIGVRKNGKQALYDGDQKQLLTPVIYDSIFKVTSDTKLIKVLKDKKYGFLNASGKVVVPCQYDDLNLVTPTLIVAQKGRYVGAIDTTAKTIIPFKYETLQVCSYRFNGIPRINFIAQKGARTSLINEQNQRLISGKNLQIKLLSPWKNEGTHCLFSIKKRRKLALFHSEKQKMLTSYRYTTIGIPKKGLIVASKGKNRFGYLDLNGQEVIPFVYQQATNFRGRAAIVQLSNEYFFINYRGKIIEKTEKSNFDDWQGKLNRDISLDEEPPPPPPLIRAPVKKRSGKQSQKKYIPDPIRPDGFEQYLKKHLKYPKRALKYRVEGQVRVRALVNSQGDLTDIEVVEGLGYGCDQEAIRLLKNSPKWTPASYDSKRYQIVIIQFELDE